MMGSWYLGIPDSELVIRDGGLEYRVRVLLIGTLVLIRGLQFLQFLLLNESYLASRAYSLKTWRCEKPVSTCSICIAHSVV